MLISFVKFWSQVLPQNMVGVIKESKIIDLCEGKLQLMVGEDCKDDANDESKGDQNVRASNVKNKKENFNSYFVWVYSSVLNYLHTYRYASWDFERNPILGMFPNQ